MVSSKRTTIDFSNLTGWYKSSHSGGDQGECLEVARGYNVVPVRDSKISGGRVLVFSADGWTSFVTAVKTTRLTGPGA
jgi:Domain of unknown function (DUF397).